MKSHLCLTLHEAVVGEPVGELTPHVLADIAKVEGLEVAEMTCVEQHEYGHDLAVRHAGGTVAVALAGYLKSMFFQLRGKIIAEFVENTENFY